MNLVFGSVGYTNAVPVIMAQHRMTSINSCIEVDLCGQVRNELITNVIRGANEFQYHITEHITELLLTRLIEFLKKTTLVKEVTHRSIIIGQHLILLNDLKSTTLIDVSI